MVRQIKADEDHHRNSEYNLSQVNNQYYIAATDDPQAVVDAVRNDYGKGKAILTETIQYDGLRIPPGVTLTALNPTGEKNLLQPATDSDCVILDPTYLTDVSEKTLVPKLEDISVDVSNIGTSSADYTSNAVTIMGGLTQCRNKVIDNVNITQYNPDVTGAVDGNGLFLDATSKAMTWFYIEGLDVNGFTNAIYGDATGNYINSVQFLDLAFRVNNCQIRMVNGGVRNVYRGVVQWTDTMEKLYHGDKYPAELSFNGFDFANANIPSNGGVIQIDEDSPATNNDLNVDYQGTRSFFTSHFIVPSLRKLHIKNEDKLIYRCGTPKLPDWLTSVGSGSVSYGDVTINITANQDANFAVDGGSNVVGYATNPRLTWLENSSDNTNLTSLCGLEGPKSSFFVGFVKDPSISSNFLFRVVDQSGSQLVEQDTGVGLTSKTEFGVALTKKRNNVIGTINGALQDVVQLDNKQDKWRPVFDITASGSDGSKTISLENRIELEIMKPT